MAAHFACREVQLCKATNAHRVTFLLDLGKYGVRIVTICFPCSYILPWAMTTGSSHGHSIEVGRLSISSSTVVLGLPEHVRDWSKNLVFSVEKWDFSGEKKIHLHGKHLSCNLKKWKSQYEEQVSPKCFLSPHDRSWLLLAFSPEMRFTH